MNSEYSLYVTTLIGNDKIPSVAYIFFPQSTYIWRDISIILSYVIEKDLRCLKMEFLQNEARIVTKPIK